MHMPAMPKIDQKKKTVKRTSSKPKDKKVVSHKEATHGVKDQLLFGVYCVLVIAERITNNLVDGYKRVFVVDHKVDANFHKEQGIKAYDKEDFDKAEVELLESLEVEDEEDLDALYHLGMTYSATERHEEALKYLIKADEIGDQDQELVAEIAKCLMHLERYQEAIDYCNEVIELTEEQDNGSNYYQLGSALEKIGKTTEAMQAYRKAIDIDPRTSLYYHSLGFMYENLGKHQDAIQCFRKAMELEKEG